MRTAAVIGCERDRKRKDIMVESIGQARTSGLNGVKLREAGKGQAGSSIGLDGTAPKIGNAQSPASRMAADGAPVDMDRVAEIKAAIASGNYPVDPDKIAERMMNLELPGKEDRKSVV